MMRPMIHTARAELEKALQVRKRDILDPLEQTAFFEASKFGSFSLYVRLSLARTFAEQMAAPLLDALQADYREASDLLRATLEDTLPAREAVFHARNIVHGFRDGADWRTRKPLPQ